MSKPDWVILCYGMNDGIYAPFTPARFQAYQKGILEAIQKVRRTGARVIVMTPPPFDAPSSGGVLLPDGLAEESYSYKTPYDKYNEVVRAYANWLVSLDGANVEVVNIYDELQQAIEQSRQCDSHYVSGDGIHPNADGHWVIAQTLLRRLF